MIAELATRIKMSSFRLQSNEGMSHRSNLGGGGGWNTKVCEMVQVAQKLSNGSSIKIAIEVNSGCPRVAMITLVLCGFMYACEVKSVTIAGWFCCCAKVNREDVFSFKLSCNCKK